MDQIPLKKENLQIQHKELKINLLILIFSFFLCFC
mgnify:CR=1 FL=1